MKLGSLTSCPTSKLPALWRPFLAAVFFLCRAAALGSETADLAEPASDHWAFRPVTAPSLPEVSTPNWVRTPLDHFVLDRLDQAKMKPSPPTSPEAWLRRVTLDLTGLPPTPGERMAFLSDTTPEARERVVERLLASPRYGERWAQHWLDVVRYADTHGFEVNTERPNAWPYRDYLIRAYNQDTGYDRFIREQLAGDVHNADPATGFLVTASVLLPGQIGQDEPSKRLARQDALDEIVVNISQTFLGLSVGCARCHDHKFDPISQKEYFAMQAFVAGVEYNDREGVTPENEPMRDEEMKHRGELVQVNTQLDRLAKLLNLENTQSRETDARLNTEEFSPLTARFVRFNIYDANRHPSLGLIEPCLDEFEIFTDETPSRNVALASYGTRVTASGSRTSESHQLKFIHDGQYGNSRSWMSDEPGRGWVLFELPEPVRIREVRWSRDREGGFTDRLATAYSLEAGVALDEMQRVAMVLPSALLGLKSEPEISEELNSAGCVGEVSDAAGQVAEFTQSHGDNAAAGADSMAKALDLLQRKNDLESSVRRAQSQRMIFAGAFREPDPIHLLHRGDPERPGELVPPAVPAVLGQLELSPNTQEQERRRLLADWLANPNNPLTARVMVNRIWQSHFGLGLVETPSDFGLSGVPPSHPELLDWLASEFIRSGWSIKQVHRWIVLSATYAQSTQIQGEYHGRDSDVRWLWRFPSRRLEAESIRDGMLAVNGQLNLQMFGRGFDLFDKRGGLTGFNPVESFEADGLRRMIYAHKVRRETEAVFGAFDCPDAGQSAARRAESTTPIQALNLFNSQFTWDASQAFASRLRSEVGDHLESQVRHAFLLALGREPKNGELTALLPVVEKAGLETFCRALYNSNEFLFVP